MILLLLCFAAASSAGDDTVALNAATATIVAAAAAEGLDCNTCPNVVEPVCALMKNGLKVTLSHRCFALCQGLTEIQPGNCEDPFNSALSKSSKHIT